MLTRRRFRDGWYLTGDYGYLSEVSCYVAGRKKDLIIVGGKNIYPQDLEALSYEVPGHPRRAVGGVWRLQRGAGHGRCLHGGGGGHRGCSCSRSGWPSRSGSTSTKNSAVALRHVRVVGPKWILKTSSGKTARAANREKFLREAELRQARIEEPPRFEGALCVLLRRRWAPSSRVYGSGSLPAPSLLSAGALPRLDLPFDLARSCAACHASCMTVS